MIIPTMRARLAVAGAILLTLSACSSSSDEPAAAPDSPDQSSAPTDVEEPSSSDDMSEEGEPASGEPILVGSSGPVTGEAFNAPDQLEGMNAAVESINASGGVNGRPIELLHCDGRFDPNGEINCARELVDAGVVVAVDPNFTADASGTANQLLRDAGIASLNRGGRPDNLTDDLSYPMGGGLPGWYYGSAAALIEEGYTNFTVLVGTSPSAQAAGELMAQALEGAGVPNQTVVFDPQADPTGETTAARAISGGVDAVGLAMPPSAIPVILSAMESSGWEGGVASCSCIVTPGVIEALGETGNGMQVVSQTAIPTDDSNTAVAQYLRDLADYAGGAAPTETSLLAWSAIHIFAELAAGMDTIDAPSVVAALDALEEPIDVGTLPPFAVAGRTSPRAEWPRLLNAAVQVAVITDGDLVPNGDGFVDPFELLDEATS